MKETPVRNWLGFLFSSPDTRLKIQCSVHFVPISGHFHLRKSNPTLNWKSMAVNEFVLFA
jgi:hypothetical protein